MTDQTTPLRDRIAEALYDHSHPGWAISFPDLDQDQRETYLARADAVLAVLPAPVDQAAVLREAADRIDRTDLPQNDVDCFDNGARWATKLLRRMADETAAAVTTRTPCTVPECDADGTGEPCDQHEREAGHAEGDHSGCGVECEAIIPTEHLRNMLLYGALPGAKGALAELERRAAAGARQDGAQR